MSIAVDGDRIDYLNSVVARMYAVKTPDIRELGNLALQTILVRRSSQEVLESDTTSKDDKKKAEATLKKVDELETRIFRLYYIASSANRSGERGWYPNDHYY